MNANSPLILAHRGASGFRPEHSLEAFSLALEQGADVLEPDLMMSADGVLVVRHDFGLQRSTDVVAHPELWSRARTLARTGDPARNLEFDVPVSALSLSELKRLRCKQPWPSRLQCFNDRSGILTFAELLDFAERESRRRGKTIVVYPELKHPSEHRAVGLDICEAFIAEMRARAVSGKSAPVWVQCFEHEELLRVRAATGLTTVALIDQHMPIEWSYLSSCADGIGIAKSRLCTEPGRDNGMTRALKQAGFFVHAWTFRDDQIAPGDDAEQELLRYFNFGVDGVFSDFPSTAFRARAQFLKHAGTSRG